MCFLGLLDIAETLATLNSSNQFHLNESLSLSLVFFFVFFILALCVRVKSRLQRCRYWLFDQAWEIAHSLKDKLAESCWPTATNQSHHRECLIVSMSSTPQLSLRFMKRPKNRKMEKNICGAVVFNKNWGCGLLFWIQAPIRPHVFTDAQDEHKATQVQQGQDHLL